MFFKNIYLPTTIFYVFFRSKHRKRLFADFFLLLHYSVQTKIVDDVLPKISWFKGPKSGSNLNYYFSLKHWFSHCFPMFFQGSTIINDYFWCHTQLFSDYCNSGCKHWSSTILRPGLLQYHGQVLYYCTLARYYINVPWPGNQHVYIVFDPWYKIHP